VLVVVALVGATASTVHPAPASADPGVDIPTPPGYPDPLAAYEAGAYSSGDELSILDRMAGYTSGSDGASIADYFSALSDEQSEYAVGRLTGALVDVGAEASLAEMAGAGAVLPIATVVGGAVVIAVGGYITYKLVSHWLDGTDHTTYVRFDRAYLGGATVTVPGSPYVMGTDYEPMSTSVAGMVPFGWFHRSIGGGQYAWVFNYGMEIAYGGAPGVCDPGYTPCYPTFSQYDTYGPTTAGVTRAEDCATLGITECARFPDDSGQSGLATALSVAATATVHALDGTHNPLTVHLDTDAYAPGHLLDSETEGAKCLVGSWAQDAHCEVAYITDTDVNTVLPRVVTQTDPGGDTIVAPTFTPTDPRTTGGRTAIATSLGDDCGRNIFNHIVDPSEFPYYGCVPESQDPNVGPTTAEPAPPTDFALPVPNVNETYDAYLTRLRALGYVGTVTDVEASEANADPQMGPQGVVSVQDGTSVYRSASWPGTDPTVALGADLTIVHNPDDVPPAEGGGEPPGGGGGGGGDCSCPPIDLTPLESVHASDHFPFGLYAWVRDGLVGGSDTTAPTFDISFPYTTTMHVDLAVLDPLAIVVRASVLFLATFGVIWSAAHKLLGWGGGGGDE
jgi:hypothetical protein